MSSSWFGLLENQNLTVLNRTNGPVQGLLYNLRTEPMVRFWVLQNPLQNRTEPNLTIHSRLDAFTNLTAGWVTCVGERKDWVELIQQIVGLYYCKK
jgi:hypothetical protein